MKRTTTVAVAVFVVGSAGMVLAQAGGPRIREFLNGFNEASVVVSTTGTGTFRATISDDEQEIQYELTFQNLEGDVLQAHIHVGHPQNQGGIVLWLCDSTAAPSPSADTPACTAADPLNTRAGTASGTLTAEDVQSVAASGIAGPTATTPGEFAEVVAMVRAGKTYVNVHTTKFPPGEIRSQIDHRDGDGAAHGH